MAPTTKKEYGQICALSQSFIDLKEEIAGDRKERLKRQEAVDLRFKDMEDKLAELNNYKKLFILAMRGLAFIGTVATALFGILKLVLFIKHKGVTP